MKSSAPPAPWPRPIRSGSRPSTRMIPARGYTEPIFAGSRPNSRMMESGDCLLLRLWVLQRDYGQVARWDPLEEQAFQGFTLRHLLSREEAEKRLKDSVTESYQFVRNDPVNDSINSVFSFIGTAGMDPHMAAPRPLLRLGWGGYSGLGSCEAIRGQRFYRAYGHTQVGLHGVSARSRRTSPASSMTTHPRMVARFSLLHV